MKKSTNVWLWALAFLLMAVMAVYQKVTGPTYPIKGEMTFNSENIKYKLPRSHGGDGNDIINILAKNATTKAKIHFKKFPSYDDWTNVDLLRAGDTLRAEIPHQERAGKIMYKIELYKDNGKIQALNDEPVVIRFKGDVPLYWLIPHILFMFFAMSFSTRTGLEAAFKGEKVLKYTYFTMILLFAGGFLLGPVIQYYAFGAFWTGWPFGYDLTDNKTLIAFIFWLVAMFRLRKSKENRLWVIIASIALIAVFLIPHSVLGSEIDYTKVAK